ncbi:his Kinase A domain protein [Pseudomonas fluorescens]|uniref:histidine kinase n=1 Tax=Pseudomonas fluorescens TaxID=294 RepID=A0A0P8XRN0_PSEFL|nr:his Kinase A domain protein [Pseudomonas fluorescens]
MTSEFRHLRACVIRLWVNSLQSPDLAYFQDMIRFNEAIDEALAESTATYAEEVNRSRDIFLAILGHDLRAPLQAVSMSTELLLRKAALEDDALKCAINIQPSTGHLAVMVGDLLELVRSASEELGEPTTSLGLGLFIVKEVVDAHQGTIEVCSSELDGTTFTVDLPRKV